MDANQIQPGFAVNGRSGELVNTGGERLGTVDHLDGDYLKLKMSDADDRKHHWIPLDWVSKVEGEAVFIDKTYDEYVQSRLDALPNAYKSAQA